MRIITASPGAVIPLGRQGENLAVRVLFPAAAWRETYGDGTFQLVALRRGDAAPYPAVITEDGDCVCWDVSDSDTAVAGQGKCELQYYVGDTLAKSAAYMTAVAPSLDPPGPAPDPYQSWIEEVLQAATDAEEAAERAEEAAERAGGLPKGGTEGQVLTKQSAEDGDADWDDLPVFDGIYEVTPRPFGQTTMLTRKTYLDRDIVVKEIPYQEAANLSGGNTATIGG